jgi:hypothetical protein
MTINEHSFFWKSLVAAHLSSFFFGMTIPVLVYEKWTEDSGLLIMKHLLPEQHIQRIR